MKIVLGFIVVISLLANLATVLVVSNVMKEMVAYRNVINDVVYDVFKYRTKFEDLQKKVKALEKLVNPSNLPTVLPTKPKTKPPKFPTLDPIAVPTLGFPKNETRSN